MTSLSAFSGSRSDRRRGGVARSDRALLLTLCVFLLAGLTSGASAGTRGARTETLSYEDPAIGVSFPEYAMETCFSGCVVFDVMPGERVATVQADDLVGPDVALAVFAWDGGVDNPRYIGQEYCTETDQPFRLPRWTRKLWVEVLIGPCSDGTPAMATQGSVTASFSDGK